MEETQSQTRQIYYSQILCKAYVTTSNTSTNNNDLTQTLLLFRKCVIYHYICLCFYANYLIFGKTNKRYRPIATVRMMLVTLLDLGPTILFIQILLNLTDVLDGAELSWIVASDNL